MSRGHFDALAQQIALKVAGTHLDPQIHVLDVACPLDSSVAHIQLGASSEGDAIWCDGGCESDLIVQSLRLLAARLPRLCTDPGSTSAAHRRTCPVCLAYEPAAREAYREVTRLRPIEHAGDGEEVGGDPDTMFTDLELLDATEPVTASVGLRSDGIALFYAFAVNVLTGDPEQGKSLVALAVAIQVARAGGIVVWLDLDHNGAQAFRSRIVSLGGGDLLAQFRFAQPEDRDGVLSRVRWAKEQTVGLLVIDSMGELLPMFGASSDSSDDYTKVHRAVLTPAAKVGWCVVVIDHLSKGTESRAYGSTGTIAKKRAIDGAMYLVRARKPFAPSRGGEADLRLLKDRHGSVRGSVDGGKEPVAAVLAIGSEVGVWEFQKPTSQPDPLDLDVAVLTNMTPPPKSQNDIRKRLSWGAVRTKRAFDEWQRRASQPQP